MSVTTTTSYHLEASRDNGKTWKPKPSQLFPHEVDEHLAAMRQCFPLTLFRVVKV